jgi:DNA-binding beta-propeller fold protein YncE
MKTQWFKLNLIALAGVTAAASACSLGDPPSDPPLVIPPDAGPRPDAEPFVPPPPPPDQDVPYKRGSLRPLYQLTPIGDQNRFDIFNVAMSNADFTTTDAKGASVAQKMAQIQFQLANERGVAPDDDAAQIFIDSENETRAQLIPFRGNPTDVKFMEFEGRRLAIVPLGGDVMTVGHEVAIVDLDNTDDVTRVPVGLHPQRVFAHAPSGLVFVCNQFSNYISIIDVRTEDVLKDGDTPIEIPTEFYCTDIVAVDRANVGGEDDELYLYVSNEFRSSVMRYSIDIIRDGIDDVDTVDLLAPDPDFPQKPELEITGVGRNPLRLNVNFDTQDELYISNGRGGEQATVRIPAGDVVKLVKFNAPSVDTTQIRDKLYIPTLTPFRGYPNADAQAEVPEDIQTDAVEDADGNEIHPGAFFDDTDAYNFEDLRNGIFEHETDLRGQELYFTDDNERDEEFDDIEKILEGSIPYDIERNAAGNRVYVVFLGNDLVQEFSVVGGDAFTLRNDGNIYNTAELPMAVALDEEGGVLLVANYGDDTLQVFDIDNANLLETVDLGYAEPKYPSTTIELGEYAYATAKWANDGRKACTTCHWDRFLVDGIEYGNGATASTMPHQVKPNYNLLETDNYFWNGSFTNNSYASLAFQAQARTNCELILFALVEGADSDPADRIGDPANFTQDDVTDPDCQPDTLNLDVTNDLPTSLNGDTNNDGVANFQDIVDTINIQKQVEFAATGVALAAQIENLNGVFDANDGQANRDTISRAMDFYGAAELRLPPNPLNQKYELEMLSAGDADKIEKGRAIFQSAGCTGCHNPTNQDGAFADARDHGRGAEFFNQFITAFSADDDLEILLPDGLPDQFLESAARDFTDTEINYHEQDQDSFQPFSFDSNLQLRFENPLASQGDEETRRLLRLALVNLADPDRGFIPGNVVGQPRVNTPSLRGVWLQYNLLRHGLALSLREAILPPGHQALLQGEKGFAVDRFGETDVHGSTSGLNATELEQLEFYVRSIE